MITQEQFNKAMLDAIEASKQAKWTMSKDWLFMKGSKLKFCNSV